MHSKTAPGSLERLSGSFELIRRFWRDFVRPHRWGVAWVGVLMALTVLLQLPTPLLTMYIIDSAVQGKSLTAINLLALAFVALILVRHVFSYLNEVITLRLKETVILELGGHLARHVQRLPLGFFANRHSTYLQSRLMNDTRSVEGALARTVVTVAMNGLTFLVGAVMVLFIRYELGLALLASLAPFAYVRYFANDRMRTLSKEMQENTAVASAVIAESFAGIRTLKSLQQEDQRQSAILERLGKLKEIYVRTNWFGILSSVGTSVITSLAIAFVLWYGVRSVMAGSMSLGEVVGVLSFLNFLYNPINSFVAANLSIQQSASALQRIYEFLLLAPETDEGRNLARFERVIEYRDVSFAYTEGKDALSGVNLKIPAGQKIALVGRSGAGKSTLVNLLLRFYETDRGQVTLDGTDVRDISLASLRNRIGIVDQQVFLFTGSIAYNIRMGRSDATQEEIVEAARKAHAHDFIRSLPQGYETLVGERGARLSGGECQRIALARLYLRDPDVVILDEAVSAIDSEAEEEIQAALRELAKGRTMIIIAHRLSSLLLAERVALIEDGRIVEDGTHRQLLERGGAYSRLFSQQFKPQLPAPERAISAV